MFIKEEEVTKYFCVHFIIIFRFKKTAVNKEGEIFIVGQVCLFYDATVGNLIKASLQSDAYTYLHEENFEMFKFFRCMMNNTLFYAAEYQRVTKQYSSVIAYQAGQRLLFGNICYFVRVYNNVYAVVKVLKVLDTCHSFFNLPHYALDYNISRIVPVLATEELHVTNVATIVQKCLYVCVLPHAYICIPPNVLLHD